MVGAAATGGNADYCGGFMAVIVDSRQGWNAGARSIRWADGDLEATLEPNEAITGCIVGLSAATDVTSLTEQTHSFMFRHTEAGAFADIYERAVLKTTLGGYTEGDVFAIRRIEGVVTYYKNDALEYTSLASSSGRVYLTAALYLAGDRI